MNSYNIIVKDGEKVIESIVIWSTGEVKEECTHINPYSVTIKKIENND